VKRVYVLMGKTDLGVTANINLTPRRVDLVAREVATVDTHSATNLRL